MYFWKLSDSTPHEGGYMSESSLTGIGKKLAILAKLKGMTQEQIAKHCKMSRISVNRFFRQHTEIRAGDLSVLLGTLGINLDQLIDKAIEKQMTGKTTPISDEPIFFTGAMNNTQYWATTGS